MPPKAAKSSGKAAKNGEFRNRIVGLEMVPANQLAQHPQNWRLHPEEQRSALLGLLESIGIADAVLAYRSEKNDGALTLIDGHLRQDLIDQEVPTLVTDLDDEEAGALLAAHDVVTTMALPDEEELRKLLDEVIDRLPQATAAAIDPDFGEELEIDGDAPAGKYEIVPQLDEGYDYVVIFSTRESEFGWLQTVLELPKKRDKTRVGTSRVLTVDEFKERWQARSDH